MTRLPENFMQKAWTAIESLERRICMHDNEMKQLNDRLEILEKSKGLTLVRRPMTIEELARAADRRSETPKRRRGEKP